MRRKQPSAPASTGQFALKLPFPSRLRAFGAPRKFTHSAALGFGSSARAALDEFANQQLERVEGRHVHQHGEIAAQFVPSQTEVDMDEQYDVLKQGWRLLK